MALTELEKLHEAASMSDFKKVQALLKKGISPTKKDKDGCDALWAAISSFFKDDPEKFVDIKKVIKLLIESGCNPNQVYEKFGNFTPLINASSDGNLAAVEVLIELKADLNKPDKYGYTPMHRAALNGYDRIVQALLDAGANPNVKTDSKESVLKIAKDGWKESKGGFNEGKDFKKTISILEKYSNTNEKKTEPKKIDPIRKIPDGKGFKAFQRKHKNHKFSPLLKSLFDYWNVNTEFFAGTFEVTLDEYDGIKEWFRNIKEGYSRVIVFGHDGLDSLYGLWLYEKKSALEAPIIYLSGEGEGSTIVCNTMEEFLSILATNRDWEPFDKKYTEPFEEYEEANEKFKKWLKSELNIIPAKNPEKIMEKAKKSHPDLKEWLAKVFT